MSNNKLKGVAGIAVGTGLAVLSGSALAVDYSSITTAVDWTDVGTSLVAIGAAIASIFVVMKGVKLVTRMVKGA